ncbi:MAG: type II toxin-antitoxin system death-on-curing family toxin [Bacilli bacterium]|nr:type II toxin-antitoxin system death-on-curing family toxin [Bacilli bacterium]
MKWITIEQIIRDHDQLIKITGGDNGILNLGMIESAVRAPLQTFDGKDIFPTIIEKVTRLSFALTVNHGFVDGNKRIGALSLIKLLAVNDIELRYTQDELSAIFLKVANNKCNYQQLLDWVNKHLNK